MSDLQTNPTATEDLKKIISSKKSLLETIQQELTEKERELEDVNKPRISKSVLDLIKETIENKVSSYMDDLDSDSFEKEISVQDDYDGRFSVEISSISFNNSDDLSEEIYDSILDEFRVVDEDGFTEEERETSGNPIEAEYKDEHGNPIDDE